MNTIFPQSRTANLVVQKMDRELVVYDTTQNEANLLNPTVATIFSLCDGKTSVGEIAARAAQQLNAPMDPAVVWYTLEQLSHKNLLQERVVVPLQYQKLTRRDFLRAGLVGAAVVLPVIVTMTAPGVSQAASCIASGQACSTPSECCSTVCMAGFCA